MPFAATGGPVVTHAHQPRNESEQHLREDTVFYCLGALQSLGALSMHWEYIAANTWWEHLLTLVLSLRGDMGVVRRCFLLLLEYSLEDVLRTTATTTAPTMNLLQQLLVLGGQRSQTRMLSLTFARKYTSVLISRPVLLASSIEPYTRSKERELRCAALRVVVAICRAGHTALVMSQFQDWDTYDYRTGVVSRRPVGGGGSLYGHHGGVGSSGKDASAAEGDDHATFDLGDAAAEPSPSSSSDYIGDGTLEGEMEALVEEILDHILEATE